MTTTKLDDAALIGIKIVEIRRLDHYVDWRWVDYSVDILQGIVEMLRSVS